MFDQATTVNLNNDNNRKTLGFVVNKGLYLIYQLENTVNTEPVHSINPTIKTSLEQTEIESLDAFANFIETTIEQKYALRSYSVAYRYNSRLFIKQKNGLIYLLRNEKVYQQPPGEAHEGEVFANDILILFAGLELKEVGTINIKELAKSGDIESIKNNITAKDGPCTLVVKISPELPSKKELFVAEEVKEPLMVINQRNKKTPINKKNIFRAVAFLLVLFLLLKTLQIAKQQYTNHQNKVFSKKVETINVALDQINSVGLNNPQELIKKSTQLQKDIEQLKKIYPKKSSVLLGLSNKVKNLTSLTGEAESEQGEVFFDLSLLSTNLNTTAATFTDNYLSVLDTKNKKAYLVNLENKSYDTFSLNNLNSATLISQYDEEIFVFDKNRGVYKSSNGKLEKIISKDSAWKDVVDLKLFNGNVYLLDRESDEIFKYIPTESGYSSTTSYFQGGESVNLAGASSLTIDYSIYVLTPQNLWKFTSGTKEVFKPRVDFSKNKFIRVFKSAETDYLYLLDVKSGRIAAINNKGAIVKSIFNNKLKTAKYFGVINEEKVLFLHQNQVYQLDSL
jgi:hypothetical protein